MAELLGAGIAGVKGIAASKESVAGAIGAAPMSRFSAGLLYNRAAAAVTFPVRPGSNEFITGRIGPTDLVTVRVTYLFPCFVPIVSAIMCRTVFGMSGASEFVENSGRLLSARRSRDLREWKRDLQELRNRANAFAQDFVELSHVEQLGLFAILAGSNGRFVVLRAEAALPNQGAYYYRDKNDEI